MATISGNVPTLVGSGTGNDVFDVQTVNTTVQGSGANETISFLAAPSAEDVNLQTGVGTGWYTVQFTDIQGVVTSPFGGTVTAAANTNLIASYAGNATILGGSASANIFLGAGNNTVQAGTGADTIWVGQFPAHNTTVGANVIDGGTGATLLDYFYDTGRVTVDLSTGVASHDGVHDQLTNINNVTGDNAGDTLLGNNAANVISGGTGNDYIDGRGGADILTGGGGHDTFVMDSNVGADEITDFNTAADVIDISAFASQFTSLAQVLAASTQVGSDTTIQLNGSSSVTLDGVSKASLTASDFSFTHIAPPVSTVHDPLNIDGTGYDGIIFRDSSTGDMGYMSANASGGETWHATGPTGTTYASLGVGDFNGDGISDVAFRDSAGDWGFMSVNSGGGETWHGVGSTSTAYSVAGVGDFGGTGQSDIAFVNPTTGDFGYMSVTTSGAEQWHALGPTSTAYTAYGAGDFLGNDSIGVLFRNNTTGDMGFMTANTSGGETWHAIGPTGTGYAVLGVGDFDGSGQDEVAFRNTSTGDWGYMTANASGSGETWHDVGNAELDYAVLKVGDFDNSGHDEIAFRSTSSGAWGYMSVNAGGGETWHAIGSTSLDYYAV